MPVNGREAFRYGTVILGTGVAYLALFLVNEQLLAFTHFSAGVNWVYLPSGLRLTLVLIFGWPAALGIAWSSMLIAAWPQAFSGLTQPLITGLISGLTPWLALLASKRWLNLGTDLSGLRVASLLQLAVIFAVASAAMHQLWYGWIQPPQDRLATFIVMAAGDLVGSLIVLYLCKWALRAVSARG